VIWRESVKCTQLRFMLRCWVKSVVKGCISLIQRDFKRFLHSTIFTYTQSFVIHARHATFYLFYAKFPNTYLRDISTYGAKYKTCVTTPIEIVIHQSKPFRMRHPKQQAEFFRLLSTVLYYMLSGYSNVGYLAAEKWNGHYKSEYNIQVFVKSSRVS
jgi:hypothetical protein